MPIVGYRRAGYPAGGLILPELGSGFGADGPERTIVTPKIYRLVGGQNSGGDKILGLCTPGWLAIYRRDRVKCSIGAANVETATRCYDWRSKRSRVVPGPQRHSRRRGEAPLPAAARGP